MPQMWIGGGFEASEENRRRTLLTVFLADLRMTG
jgi:hypothetical protein